MKGIEGFTVGGAKLGVFKISYQVIVSIFLFISVTPAAYVLTIFICIFIIAYML